MSENTSTESWDLPPSAAVRVDRACTAFEGAWKAGGRPRVEDYLGDSPPAQRAAQLRELLRLDVEYRGRAGEQPAAAEYRTRFPDLAAVVAEIFAGLKLAAVPQVPGYRIVREVGRGGMGIVYEAEQLALGRRVALKVLIPGPGASPERFLREAQLLAKVASPHVVAVHDFMVLPDGSPVLVMEWVEGSDLRKVMKERGGPLGEAEALPWMRQTCEGMLAAAEQGIIHRDLKPHNILIDAKGRARVADFGLARGPHAPDERSLTRGGAMGTAYYMAPEQAENPRGVDTRADVYSFGATFYHALTGAPPFDGETTFVILYKHKTEPLIPPKARHAALSDRLNEVLERCLAKSPADRFGSFAELLQQLQPTAGTPAPWDATDDAELAPYLARYQSRRAIYLSGKTPWEAPELQASPLWADLSKKVGRMMEWDAADPYPFPGGRTLTVVHGDITRQRVGAVVSSDTCFLGMNYGVSLAIRQAAGQAVAQEAQRFADVRPGRVVVTPAGALPARFIFHGVTIGVVSGEVVTPSRDLIAEIVESCFYHADSLSVQSLALPLLGTGALGFSREVCLDTMFRVLARMLLRGLTAVREARVVIFP